MKTCFKCGSCKPFSEFYRHKGMADGHLNKCKSCAKGDVAQHRAENIEQARAYDRERGSLPHRVAAREAYRLTDAYKESHHRANDKYRAFHPERDKARNAVNNAIRDGRLIPWPVCAVPECNCTPEAHHPDYSRPLDVVWLCDGHHKATHKLARDIERLAA